ncbi:sensor domain-containing diguanylate cyclase [Nocardia mikamii]|uniref:sensor domain-containing diguanylate cyclase n=1 Tax=Nocardia mikamii TaxID=508464 RepID=UPI0007C6E3DF|nr:sensor domain-containing diguanylate cyclase [Nocardia mikamii]
MDDLSTALAQQWERALATITAHPSYANVEISFLRDLLEELHASLTAEDFDAAAGSRAGAALAGARLTDPAVPVVSAPVLHRLTEFSDHPDTGRRMATLLVAFGHGHHFLAEAIRADDVEEGQRRFRLVFDHASIAIAIGDTNGVLLEANPHLADMIGVPVDSLRGISVYDFAHPDDQAAIRQMVYDDLVPARAGTAKIERRLQRADGSTGWATFAITYVRSAFGPDYLLAIGEDVTERHQLQEQLHYQARHDALTELPNRRHLLDTLRAVISTAGENDLMGLCFTDLDHFKEVNDRYGHGVGDQVLATVARRLHDSLQDDGCLVARIGGDEFVTLIPPPADTRRVSAVADRLRGALSHPLIVGGHRLHISASIGAVVTPVAGKDPEWLLDAADTSLYDAKSGARGNWILHTVHAAEPAGESFDSDYPAAGNTR